MPDTTLDALLCDPSPEARLIAADWLEERGRELDALIYRIEANQRVVRVTERGWRVSVSWGSYRPCLSACLDAGASDVPFWWRYADAGAWAIRYGPEDEPCDPPPGLEDAVCRVLQRRLEEITGA
jgi:hypothetical protein